MKLIDADALRQAILSTMPERSEVLLIVDNQPEKSVEEIEAFLREKEPFMFECGNNTGK